MHYRSAEPSRTRGLSSRRERFSSPPNRTAEASGSGCNPPSRRQRMDATDLMAQRRIMIVDDEENIGRSLTSDSGARRLRRHHLFERRPKPGRSRIGPTPT